MAWPANDFAVVQPLLERTLEVEPRAGLSTTVGPAGGHVADALIEEADYGMTVATLLRPLFPLYSAPAVDAAGGCYLSSSQRPTTSLLLYRHYPEQQQWDFGVEVIQRFGYDFQCGPGQDKTHHPFMITFGPGDVRITTHFRETTWATASSRPCTSRAMPCTNRASVSAGHAAGRRCIGRRP